SPSEWSSRNASRGCVRKRGQESICKSGDGFVKVENVKPPDSSLAQLDEKLSLKECEQKCLQNCSCTAYGGVDTEEQVGCLRWHGDLIDTTRERQLKFFIDATASSTTSQDSQKLDEGRRKPYLPIFDISTILIATDNFSPTKRLGQGGFGSVYKIEGCKVE
ncbi:g-type lectin s-receptor-like serine/threonine-protein kinase, partial [Quercus suber]